MSIEAEINFSIKCLNTFDTSTTTTLFSPASLLSSLAFIYAGSDRLENQFSKLLGEAIDSKTFLKFYSDFIRRCQKSTNSNNDDCKIFLSNFLFLSSKKPLNQSFVQAIAAAKFDESLKQIDFSAIDVPKSKDAKEKAAKKLCKEMNDFVIQKTAGKIKDMVKIEELSSNMNCLILSALRISGKWEEPFSDPIPQTFNSSSTAQKTIPFLTKNISIGGCNFSKGNNWKCLGVPYKTRDMWLHILLPNRREDLPYILEKLSFSFIKRCFKSNPNAATVRATIPAFKIENSMEITNNLGRAGLTLIFQNEDINLMVENDQVNLDKIFHKVLFNIDKNGSGECSAEKLAPDSSFPFSCDNASGDTVVKETFIANQPFLFFITLVRYQNPSKMKNILFMGTFS